MIAIIDYGMGNLRSVQKSLEAQDIEAQITSEKAVIERAQGLILPGVGAFGRAMKNLQANGLIEPLREQIKAKTPFLGICLGMQLLMDVSSEHGPIKGISLVEGEVKGFTEAKDFPEEFSVPHMGWNEVKIVQQSELFAGLPDNFQAYFVHSYYVDALKAEVLIGKTNYGIDFCSALQKENIYGLQFHPEKSGSAGLKIMKNFAQVCGSA